MSKKNYVDDKGNYHNIQNLTLAQIYLSGFEDGYKVAKEARKQGEWIMNKDGNPECPFCHHSFTHWSHFCSNCGADMRWGQLRNIPHEST